MSTATPALIGQFTTDCRSFSARPVRLHGQPTRMLPQLAAIYTAHRDDVSAATGLLMAHCWAELNTAAGSRPGERQHALVPNVGHRDLIDAGLVAGDVVADQPWRTGEWAYLWEHRHGALHVYVAAGARWHHLATVTVKLLHRLDGRLAADIEGRMAWLEPGR